MLSVDDALKLVLQHCGAVLPPVRLPLADAFGLVLAEDVASDLDMPPCVQAMMDGFAIRAADLAGGRAELTIIDTVLAGQSPTRTVGQGEAARIMTGAPIPAGADAVVMVERSQPKGEHLVV